MLKIYFCVGAGVLALVVFLLVLNAPEGFEDEDGFKLGKPPGGAGQQKNPATTMIGRDVNSSAGSQGGEA